MADLRYADKRAAEKHMKQQEGFFGASGSVGTYLMVELEGLIRSINTAAMSFT